MSTANAASEQKIGGKGASPCRQGLSVYAACALLNLCASESLPQSAGCVRANRFVIEHRRCPKARLAPEALLPEAHPLEAPHLPAEVPGGDGTGCRVRSFPDRPGPIRVRRDRHVHRPCVRAPCGFRAWSAAASTDPASTASGYRAGSVRWPFPDQRAPAQLCQSALQSLIDSVCVGRVRGGSIAAGGVVA